MVAILNSIVLNIYYGMLRGQINMYLPPEHPIIDIWNKIQKWPPYLRNELWQKKAEPRDIEVLPTSGPELIALYFNSTFVVDHQMTVDAVFRVVVC